MVDLDFVYRGIFLNKSCWANDFFSGHLKLVRLVLSSGHVADLELIEAHTVTNKQMVRHTSMIVFNILFKILVFFVIKQVLLCPLWNIISK